MEMLEIHGPCRIAGEITVQGAKNGVLPLLAASVLCRGESVFHHCPRLSDVETSAEILRHLGCSVSWQGDSLIVDAAQVSDCEIPDHLMRKMRSSIVFLGGILARTGRAELSYPGGCELGPRPIDLHLYAIRQLGAAVLERHGRISCKGGKRLRGTVVTLSFPSVGATENLLLTAVTAKGTTTIHNAAREPEIADLAVFLNGCGAEIHGAGESTITIHGVPMLHGCAHTILPDRIAAATWLCAAAATGGEILLRQADPAPLRPVAQVLEQAGCGIRMEGNRIALIAPERLHAVDTVRTMPYPGFPTDAQAPVMAALLQAEGSTIFVENIFENRFRHADELTRMGANIRVAGRVAVVQGARQLSGAQVVSPDLRGGAALVIAGLAAEGTTRVLGVEYIDRGYAAMETELSRLGGNIVRAALPDGNS